MEELLVNLSWKERKSIITHSLPQELGAGGSGLVEDGRTE
jgi:hypothetical protein